MDFTNRVKVGKYFESMLDYVGNTPMVKINKLNPNKNVNVFAKLEGENPGGSVKDRIALSMILEAEERGELTPDKIILEPTSGNTGIGLAIVAAVKGYRLVLTMSEGMSEERKDMLRALGAELVLTDRTKGTDGAIVKAHEMLKENPDKYWMPNQFDNPDNPKIHYQTTANEIIEQVGRVDVFVATLGTSGTMMGAGRRLKEVNPQTRLVAVEPFLGHKLQGMKNMQEAIVPKLYDPSVFDEKVNVKDEDAHEMSRQLALKEGIFVGMSAGACMVVALQKAKERSSGNIVAIIPDRGERYLSTILFKKPVQNGLL